MGSARTRHPARSSPQALGAAAGRKTAAGSRPRPGMSRTESAATRAPPALIRKAISKPAFSGSPLARTWVAMMLPAAWAPMAEPMLRMIVLTPVASPVSRAETAVTMRLGIAANAAPEPALTRQLQRMTSPTESWVSASPSSAPATTRQPARNGALEPAALADAPDERRDQQRGEPAGGEQQAGL